MTPECFQRFIVWRQASHGHYSLAGSRSPGTMGELIITNHILDGTLSILKYRVSPGGVSSLYWRILERGVLDVPHVSEDLEGLAFKLFKGNIGGGGFSCTDAVIVVAAKSYGIEWYSTTLLTFNILSPGGLLDNIVGLGCWESLPQDEKDRIRVMLGKCGLRLASGVVFWWYSLVWCSRMAVNRKS